MKQLLKQSKQRGHVVAATGSTHELCINTLKARGYEITCLISQD